MSCVPSSMNSRILSGGSGMNINMLEQQVNPGYTEVETANKKQADSFK